MKKPVKKPVKKAVSRAVDRALDRALDTAARKAEKGAAKRAVREAMSRAVDRALDTAAKKAEKSAAKKAAKSAAKKAAKKRPARKTRARARRSGTPHGQHLTTPHLCRVRAPTTASPPRPFGRRIVVATYNVHRWTGVNGRNRPDPARAGFVISELQADVIALQEVLRPLRGDDPLEVLSDALGLHMAFAATRVHRRGELGNAILSRWPIIGVSMLDLSFSRLERRLAVAAQFQLADGMIDIVATHLALGDRTRHLQVRSLVEHPRFRDGPTLLMGDMNAWRDCRATRALDDALSSHHNLHWPASFPSTRPVLALDRIYARGVHIAELSAHASPAARRASDHLPVVARVELPD